MKTVTERLRDADPLGYEPHRSAQELRTSRRRLLDAPVLIERPRRRSAIAAACALALGAILAGSIHWLRTSVDVLAAVRFEIRLAEDKPAPGLHGVPLAGTDRTIYLYEDAIVTNDDVVRAQVVQGDSATTFSVAVTLTADAGARMLAATRNHVGQPVAILLDGEVVTAPVVRAPVSTSGNIGGKYTRAEADRIVAGIVGR